jgi:hypothetical protein
MTVDVIELNMEVVEKLGWRQNESGVAFTKNWNAEMGITLPD